MSIKTKAIKVLLSLLGLVPVVIIIAIFTPGIQKYIVENQLNNWISDASVDSISISPFSIKINNLNFKYEAIDIHLGHLDSEISPFSLFSQRIKIDKFILNHVQINDSTILADTKDDAIFLFPGLFPYLDNGFIYDINLLNVQAEYNSPATGFVEIAFSGEAINENTANPVKLKLISHKPQLIPDIQTFTLNASIILQQSVNPINAHQSHFELKLTGMDNIQQTVTAQLSMKQLAKPDKWASFPFDKLQTHYLKKRLHPESIDLKITHTNQNNKVLSDINYTGQYDGNEGIILGQLKLLTDKEFTSLFKSLNLPKIDSQLTTTFKYNTRSLEGHFDLTDELKIEDYMPSHSSDKGSSLPKKIEISNHLNANIDDKQLTIDNLLLSMLSGGQEYLKIITHKEISINLDNLQEFLEQKNNDLLNISISKLPINWFDDFVADYQIKEGYIDTDINLAVENKTLKLVSNRPINLNNITILEKIKDTLDSKQELTVTDKTAIIEEHTQTNNELLTKQNLKADFNVTINNKNLSASVKQLQLYQNQSSDEIIEQISSSLIFNMKEPVHYFEALINGNNKVSLPETTLETSGKVNIRALTHIPVISKNIDSLTLSQEKTLSDTLPKTLLLNYQFNLNAKETDLTINKSTIEVFSKKPSKQTSALFSLENTQKIQFKQNQNNFSLLTKGKLFSSKVKHFDFNWISPLIQEYATPYRLSGQLDNLDFSIFSIEENKDDSSEIKQDSFKLDINKLKLSKLQSYENDKLLFKNINISSKINVHYSPEKIIINYPIFLINKGKKLLLNNSGNITINHPTNPTKQQLSITGKLNGYLNHMMNLSVVDLYINKKEKLSQKSLLDSQYNFSIQDNKILINRSKFKVTHPKNNGRLIIATQKPISLSLKDKQHNFSQNGHLTFELIDFNLKPYEGMIPGLPITFDHANGHFDLIQTSKKQNIVLNKPFKINNIHFIDKEKRLLDPFDIKLNFSASQKNNITQGEIKELSITFLDDKKENNKINALNLKTKFKLDLDKSIILSELDGNLDLMITHWLKQPVAIPLNTLTQGTLNTQFTIDKNHNISHRWLINNLVADNDKQLVESISINGSGKLKSLSSFSLELPITMKSVSGESDLLIKTQTDLLKEKKRIAMEIDGETVYLNDLLKLLSAINPESELSQLESSEEVNEKDNKAEIPQSLDKTPALEAFWKSGFDISAQIKMNTLYYSDYMSYQDIVGQLDMTDEILHAQNFKMKFHDSPMTLDAIFDFDKTKEKPYQINFKNTLGNFSIGSFLTELNPEHVTRADGVFDVDVNIFGELSNLSQFRNELLFDILIKGKNGVFHLIPQDDIMMRSSGTAMAVVGEVVSVLPTSGFGLGIVNRVIRFAKDIDYDFIKMHLVRKKDLDTKIEIFQIISPELHLLATGGLSFVEDTRLFDQPLDMTAQINLAGEGAAIFYGLALLEDEQDELGFWKGPVINFSGTLNHQNDNFNEIISKAKSGTVVGGLTNPFSGLIGNFRYRWFGDDPDYSELHTPPSEKQKVAPETKKKSEPTIKTLPVKEQTNPSFFDATF